MSLIVVSAVVADIVANITNLIAMNIDDDEHAKERAFTQQVCEQTRQQLPNLNVMVVHPAFTSNFFNATHQHVELPLTPPRTQGYEVYAFTSGTFTLNGDGGFENWCFDGNYVRDGNNVTFSDPSPSPPPPVVVTPPPPPPTIPTPIPPYPQQDGVFLVNSNRNGVSSSGFAYYKDCSQAQGNQPTVYIDIKTNGEMTWEGMTSSGTFPDGDVFQATVDAGAGSLPPGSACGSAKNAFRTMTVYKDTFRQLYNINGWNVDTVYLCT